MGHSAAEYGWDLDGPLISRAREGDEAAFAELVRRHSPTGRQLARSILRDPEEAEDELQNAWLLAFRHLGRFAGESRFSTWLHRIVVNQCLMRLRRRKPVYYGDWGGEEERAFEAPDPTPDPEAALGRREVERLIRREVRRLPPLLREPLLLQTALPMTEVARRLEISESAAKSRLVRARQELRARLDRYGGAGLL